MFEWLVHRCEMADRIRAYDWTSTPIGHPNTWPQSLRFALNLCLASKHPMYVWWGPSFINFYNDAYIALAGSLKHPRFFGRPAREMWPEVWESMLVPFIHQVRETGEAVWRENLEMPLERKGVVESGYFTFSFSPIFDENGQFQGVICPCHETTTTVFAERELLATVRDLRAEQDLRERFVTALSHDLRTPLTAAKMSAQMLVLRPIDQAQLHRIANRIASNMDRADEMIRDILDASRIKAGQKIPIDVIGCDLHAIVRAALDNLASMHGDRFGLDGDGPIEGHWDCSALQRVVENLAGNAVKYGDGDSPITVTVVKSDDGPIVELRVHNHGEPIPPEELPRLFTTYLRTVGAARSGQKGWGIGLSLVKGLAEAHGGSVSLRSSAEEGTTFIVRLPRDARQSG